MTFSEKLKQAMQELNLNQRQVCGMTGKSKGSISQYLSGKQIPSESAQSAIAVALGLAPDYFEIDEKQIDEVVKPVPNGNIRKVSTKELSEILGVDRGTAAKIAINRELPGLYGVRTTANNHLYFINDAIFCKV